MRPPITTWVMLSEDGSPMKIKARCGELTVGFAYDDSLSLTSNHKAAALEMAMVMGFTVSEASRLEMVQTLTGFEHRIGPSQGSKAGASAGIFGNMKRGA